MGILKHDDLNSLQEEALTTESPERLQYLLKRAKRYKDGKTIRRAIMNNPNTPLDMFFKLGADFQKNY